MPSHCPKYTRFFKRITYEHHNVYQCIYCQWEKLMKPSASTSSIRWHLAKRHSDVPEVKAFLDGESNNETTIKKPKPSPSVTPKIEPKLEFMDNQSIEDYIAENLMPSSTNEDLGSFDRTEEFRSPNASDSETERIEDAIMTMLATDALPLSTVENPGFIHLMSVLKPDYQPKSRDHFELVVMPRVFRKRNQS